METSTKPALIIAAHGSPVEPLVNRSIRELADSVSRSNRFSQVVASFHYGDPWYSKALVEIEELEVIVVPLMTSEGYFTKVVLQDAMKSKREGQRVKMTEPVGTHHGVADLFRLRVEELSAQFEWDLNLTDILLVGHGTRKHSTSRDATFSLAGKLKDQLHSFDADVVAGFIDDDPTIDVAARKLEKSQVLVLPFLIANGPHARVDIPRALGISEKKQPEKPKLESVDGRHFVLDVPFGVYPQLESLVLDRASSVTEPGAQLEVGHGI